jgi:hypothetical protein
MQKKITEKQCRSSMRHHFAQLSPFWGFVQHLVDSSFFLQKEAKVKK